MQMQQENRSYLLNLINRYKSIISKVYDNKFPDQDNIIQEFNKFINNNPNCFLRENIPGHITGSAFVINRNLTKVLLTYHAKLQRWLQLGGHADGEFIIQNVSLREAREESGIDNFQFLDILNFPSASQKLNFTNIMPFNLGILPFDLDVHLIPERTEEPAHYHYDVRFILVSEHENFKISPESLDLKWIDIDDIKLYTNEESTLRQVYKLKHLLTRIMFKD